MEIGGASQVMLVVKKLPANAGDISLALILGKEGPFSPEITPSLCAINLSTLSLPPGFEGTGPAPSAPLPITCHLLVQSCPNFEQVVTTSDVQAD